VNNISQEYRQEDARDSITLTAIHDILSFVSVLRESMADPTRLSVLRAPESSVMLVWCR
jgi:hypothetical protein